MSSIRPLLGSDTDLPTLPVGEHHALCRSRLEHLVPVREPLVLISQVQRSGGTLLSQLFDGHPECHAHPHELRIGYPKKWDWPQLDHSDRERWFPMLSEGWADKHLRRGYRKSPRKTEEDLFPFLFLPGLQRLIFERGLGHRPSEAQRRVLDCYFTSYFNAWLDNHNLYTGPKRIVTGFTAALNMEPSSVERFFDDYPDGTLISIVRHPAAWYASARRHRWRSTDLEKAIERWRLSASSTIEARHRYRERVVALTYEYLVQETAEAMARLAEQVGIAMSPTLLVPTFNGRPIRANSSAPVTRHGILPERAHAHRETLDTKTLSRIEELTDDLYQRARNISLENA